MSCEQSNVDWSRHPIARPADGCPQHRVASNLTSMSVVHPAPQTPCLGVNIPASAAVPSPIRDMHSSAAMDDREGHSDDCSSRSGSGESRRSSASYTGLPPTPQFVPHSMEDAAALAVRKAGADYSPTLARKRSHFYTDVGEECLVVDGSGKTSTRGLPARWLQSRWDQDAVAAAAKAQQQEQVSWAANSDRPFASVPSRHLHHQQPQADHGRAIPSYRSTASLAQQQQQQYSHLQ